MTRPRSAASGRSGGVTRLWKVCAQDQGVHALCQYLIENPHLEVLDLMDNQISRLGCHSLGKAFTGLGRQLHVTKVPVTAADVGPQRLRLRGHAGAGGGAASESALKGWGDQSSR